ncbi:MAG: VOC family protein [Burkholderiales bacterium]
MSDTVADTPSKLDFWFDHGGISVPNLAESIAWYERVLGFEVFRRRTIESVPCEMAMLRNGDLYIELFEAPGAAPLPKGRRLPDEDIKTHGNKHVSFAVDDVPWFAAELKKRGADIVWVTANIFMRDNSGNLIEFVQRPRPVGMKGSLEKQNPQGAKP